MHHSSKCTRVFTVKCGNISTHLQQLSKPKHHLWLLCHLKLPEKLSMEGAVVNQTVTTGIAKGLLRRSEILLHVRQWPRNFKKITF
mmetsp:Transcript_6166/g.10227  ORF Transcript_6166/g.10227 Transcript_6166/m.10227 type:complete len:86 (-) Transcript_6166:1338-1595(-)